MLWDNKIALHTIYFAVLLFAVVYNVARPATATAVLHIDDRNAMESSTPGAIKDLTTRIGWPPLLWLICLNSTAVPIRYALLPPTIPNREQLLKRNPVLRASYPKEKDTQDKGAFFGKDTCYTLCGGYVLSLLGWLIWK